MIKKSRSVLNNRAVNHTHKGNYKKASDMFESILSVDPGNLQVLYNYGFNFLEWGEKEKAIEVFDRIADTENTELTYASGSETAEDAAEVIANCGVACYDRAYYKEAEKYYHAADKRDPDNSSLLNHMGVLFFVTGKYNDAESLFERAVKYDENNIDSWFNLSDTYEMLGKTEECSKARYKFLELEKKLTSGS